MLGRGSGRGSERRRCESASRAGRRRDRCLPRERGTRPHSSQRLGSRIQFRTGNLHFSSTSYDWLVIIGGDKAKFKGIGTINGLGDYGFMITAVDDPAGDTFRIEIWARDTGEIVYDKEGGVAGDRYDATLLGGGSIVVHNGK